MLLNKLEQAGVIHPPKWLTSHTHYLCIMGSMAYGVSADNSDMDIYGFCVPHEQLVYPHLAGVIPGFGRQVQKFEQWVEAHIPNPDGKDITYDFAVYSIVKFFQLCMENNPNMIDSLFVPRRCILHSTHIGEHVRTNRKLFLHKGAWHKFKGYAYSQMSRINHKVNSSNPARAANIEKLGYDVKFAYHVVRLLNEVEQIMVEGDLDLERNREQLKSIRRGEWTLELIKKYFVEKESALENTYANSTLQHSPDEEVIKKILLECLEMAYGSMQKVKTQNANTELLQDLKSLISRYS